MLVMSDIPVEYHPLEPFLPPHARILMLGSFPPPLKRWSMHFFYPNMQNDMWRIMGLLFYDDKNYFVDTTNKQFRKDELVRFLTEKGIAVYDTACAVKRLQQNASDKYLEVVKMTDLSALLTQIPHCKALITTGQKATDLLRAQFDVDEPSIGCSSTFHFQERELYFYRLPSSSRAYPLALEKKAAFYRHMLQAVGIL